MQKMFLKLKVLLLRLFLIIISKGCISIVFTKFQINFKLFCFAVIHLHIPIGSFWFIYYNIFLAAHLC